MTDVEMLVDPDGTVQFVYRDDLADALRPEAGVEGLSVLRASHVEPFGQGWIADMRPVGGPVLWDTRTDNPLGRVAFPTREAALDAELAWLSDAMAARKLAVR